MKREKKIIARTYRLALSHCVQILDTKDMVECVMPLGDEGVCRHSGSGTFSGRSHARRQHLQQPLGSQLLTSGQLAETADTRKMVCRSRLQHAGRRTRGTGLHKSPTSRHQPSTNRSNQTPFMIYCRSMMIVSHRGSQVTWWAEHDQKTGALQLGRGQLCIGFDSTIFPFGQGRNIGCSLGARRPVGNMIDTGGRASSAI